VGFDFYRSENDAFSMGQDSWAHVYALSVRGGWEPRGTEPPRGLGKDERKAWDGGYDSNDGQILTDLEATAMVLALEKMLPELRDRSPRARSTDGAATLPRMDEESRSYFDSDKRKMLIAFIDFLRRGACEIR
jgi:hypothetical protein